METSSFWQYTAILRKRLWVILLLFAATMVIILGRAWSTPPSYRSSLALQVIPLEPEEVLLYSRANTISTSDVNDLILFQFSNVVRSPDVALRAIAATGVNITAADLVAGVQTTRDPSGDKLTVAVIARSPEDAEQLVVALVEQALIEFQQSRSRPAVASGKFLETQLASADRDLTVAKEALLRFKLANNMESVAREMTAEQDIIRSLNSGRETANLEAQRLTAMAEELARQSKDAERAAQQAEAAPDVSGAAEWLQIAQELTRSADNRRVEAAGQRQVAVSYTALISQHQGNLASLITLSGEYQKLDDTIRERQDTRDFLVGKAREARLKQSQSQEIGYLQVISQPMTPGGAISTRILQISLLGGGLSLVAGVVLIFLLEFLEQTVRQRPRRSR